jgi:hypothetical protein
MNTDPKNGEWTSELRSTTSMAKYSPRRNKSPLIIFTNLDSISVSAIIHEQMSISDKITRIAINAFKSSLIVRRKEVRSFWKSQSHVHGFERTKISNERRGENSRPQTLKTVIGHLRDIDALGRNKTLVHDSQKR